MIIETRKYHWLVYDLYESECADTFMVVQKSKKEQKIPMQITPPQAHLV